MILMTGLKKLRFSIITVAIITLGLILYSPISSAVRYSKADSLFKQGDITHAAFLFAKLDDYKDSKKRALALWQDINTQETISASDDFAVALKSNGTVIATEFTSKYYYGQCNVSDWTDIVAVCAGTYHTIGLKSDGTVIATDYRGEEQYYNGQCDVSDWTEIVAVAAGDRHTAGLKADGTVVTTNQKIQSHGDVSEWIDITAIAAASNHTVGLKSDGTVVATGTNEYGQCNVSDWTDIVAISTGFSHTIGLKSDGTVVATEYTYDFYEGQCDVSSWSDIIGIAASRDISVGIRSDGTIITTHNSYYRDIDTWADIVAVSIGYNKVIIALKADGSIVSSEYTDETESRNDVYDVSGWKDIKTPLSKEKIDQIRTKHKKQLELIEKEKPQKYQEAVAAEAEGNTIKAAMLYGSITDYKDSKEKSFKLWNNIAIRESISVGSHIIGLKKDGTVSVNKCSGNHYREEVCDFSGWYDIVSVSAGSSHSVGLKADGTVVAVRHDDYYYHGECNVSGWTDIVAVSAGASHTVGLKADGTVIATGSNYHHECAVSDWTDIIAISAGESHTVGLKSDGTVVATEFLDTARYYQGQCDVSDWTDIVAVSAGSEHTVGLKSDGTVVTTEYIDNEYQNYSDVLSAVFDWTDIVAVSAGRDCTIGLKSDGTVVIAQNPELYDGYFTGSHPLFWEDIVAVSAGGLDTLGLKSDGTVVVHANIPQGFYSNPEEAYSHFNLSDFKNLRLPQ